MKNRIVTFVAVLALFTMIAPRAVAAQRVNSNTQSVNLTYAVTETITISVSGSGLMAVASGNTGDITLTGSYNLVAANHTAGIKFATYFATTTALTGPQSVPTSAISTAVNGTWTGVACTATDTDSVNGGVGVCFEQTLVPQATINTTPVGTLPTTQIVYGFFGGGAPTKAGSYSGTATVIAYAL